MPKKILIGVTAIVAVLIAGVGFIYFKGLGTGIETRPAANASLYIAPTATSPDSVVPSTPTPTPHPGLPLATPPTSPIAFDR